MANSLLLESAQHVSTPPQPLNPSTSQLNHLGGYFITGTDTNVGKTFVTALLTRNLRNDGHGTVAIKPIASGSLEDAKVLRAAADNELTLEEITPVFYKAPLAPCDAAPLEGRVFSCEEVLPRIERLKKKYSSILVEGVGGWLVPLSENYLLADLARAIGFPVLLVVRNRLGALNHTLLTLDSIKSYGLTCDGIILNHHPEDKEDPAIPGYRHFFRKLSKNLNFPIFLEM